MKKENIYAIEMLNITKTFLQGKIIANSDINLRVKKGEIHALIGENGAGKSTLMSILFGLYEQDFGIIKLNEQEVVIKDPISANKHGIGMVHQHFKLVETYNVVQNIILGSEPTLAKQVLNFKKAKRKILEISEKYNLHVPLNKKIANLSVGEQQRVEILKTLYRDPSVIVFDEPTAVLTPQEIDGLLKVMQELRNNGKTIIFITHKLWEVKKVADYATVIRYGKVVETFNVKDKDTKEMAESMVGHAIVDIKNNHVPAKEKVILKVNNLSVGGTVQNSYIQKFMKWRKKKCLFTNKNKINNSKNSKLKLNDFNLEIKAGEIVAIAGVEGNGQSQLVEAITGLKKASNGSIILDGADITRKSIKQRYKHGISHIPEDRHKYGMILDFTVIQNMVLQTINNKEFSRYGFIKSRNIQKYAQEIIRSYDVRGSRGGFAVSRNLSGGNQQKAVVGREISNEHKLLVVFQPTRGLDVGAIDFIHKQILIEKEKNNAVLLVSYELDEIMSLADKIVVLSGGNTTGVINAKDAKRDEIGLMMAGKVKSNEQQ